jgi:hypothetical protein
MSAAGVRESSDRFVWTTQPRAAAFVDHVLADLMAGNRFAARLAERMLLETGTRFGDWIDHIGITRDIHRYNPRDVGFQPVDGDPRQWVHSAGLFPTIYRTEVPTLAIKVDSVDDFVAAHSDAGGFEIMGPRQGRFRRAELRVVDPTLFVAIERHGYRGIDPIDATDDQIQQVASWTVQFQQRPRPLTDEAQGFTVTSTLFDACQSQLGRDWACDLFFQAERSYWLTRNRAGRFQYERQQTLGLGWANHDHHTYRSSRVHFAALIQVLEQMGFYCRERFYAGRDAGWGAQVLEHPVTGVTIFADVDLSPEEVSGDFAHDGLVERPELGTVGLWCKLHGESFLRAGLHHLECQFDFDHVTEQLADAGVKTMAPFTNFPFLRQAFTQGEIWQVDRTRLAALVAAGSITPEQSARFAQEGAIGSHLEVLERNDGYKGFNQTGISDIIHRTDPRFADQSVGG